jgi:putative transcriptional regulator
MQRMRNALGVLAPGLLIAAPPLGDPNFDRTVVLLALHGDEGALGFVVNRPGALTLGELIARAGYADAEITDDSPVYVGGPVQPGSGWIVSLDPALRAEEGSVIAVGERIRVSSSRDAFDQLVRDAELRHHRGPDRADPKRRIVLLGYSGWGPGQLEAEIAAGAWLPVPLDEGVIFDVATTEKWERAYGLLGLTPAGMMGAHHVGEA